MTLDLAFKRNKDGVPFGDVEDKNVREGKNPMPIIFQNWTQLVGKVKEMC